MSPILSALDRLDAVLADLDLRLNNGERVAAAASVLTRRAELHDRFQQMAEEAAVACQAPFGGVTIVDDTWATLLACTTGSVYDEGSPTGDSFCQFVAGTGHSFMVEDSSRNPLTRSMPPSINPDWPVRAYYGSPVFSANGWPLGSFCIADTRPRRWRTAELLLVDAYAAQVTEMLREP